MRYLALISLICLMGGAAAQTMFTGEGYGSTQLSFFNGPNSIAFDPFVQSYWNSYINDNGTLASGVNPTTSMDIWYNTFPLSFDTQVQLRNSSLLTGSSAAASYSQADWDRIMLNRNTISNFNSGQGWKYTPIYTPSQVLKTSFDFNNPDNTSQKESSGQVLTQSIINSFTS